MPIFNHFLVTYGALVSTWMNGRYNPNTFNLIATTHSTVTYGILCEQGRYTNQLTVTYGVLCEQGRYTNHLTVTYGVLCEQGRYTNHLTVTYGVLCEQGRYKETVQLISRLLSILNYFPVVICTKL